MNLTIGIIAGLVTMVSWGTADFFAAFSSRKVGHFVTLFWVFVIAFVSGLTCLLFSTQSINLSLGLIATVSLVGLLQAIALLYFYHGLEIGLVSVVSPIASSYSVLVVLLGVFLLKEQLTILQILGIFLIFVGVPLVSINIQEIKNAKDKFFKKGVKESFLSMVFWGFSYFLLAPLVHENGWYWPTIMTMFFIAFFLFIYGIYLRKSFWKVDSKAILAISSDGLLTIVGYLAYSIGLTYSLVSIVTPISTIFPVATIILARIFFKEKLFWNQILGIGGVIGGLILISL